MKKILLILAVFVAVQISANATPAYKEMPDGSAVVDAFLAQTEDECKKACTDAGGAVGQISTGAVVSCKCSGATKLMLPPLAPLPAGVTEYTYNAIVTGNFESPESETKIKNGCAELCSKNGKKPAPGRSGRTFDAPPKELQFALQAALLTGKARCYCK